MLIADQTVVNIAVPSIRADLDITGAGLSWVVNAYPEGRDRDRALGIWAGAAGTGGAVGVLSAAC